MRKAVLFPDCHFPFHSVKAWNVAMQITSDIQPDEFILLGDFVDAYNLSGHGPRNPMVPDTLVNEIDSANAGLDEIDKALPLAKKTFIEGNHEFRLERYLLNNAPELFGLTDIRMLLGFDKRYRWEWVSYGPNQSHRILGTDTLARHEPLKNSPALTIKEAGSSLFYGHIHKIESAWKTNLDGKKLVGGCPGWLGNPKSLAFNYIKGVANWQWGITVIMFDKKNAPHPFFVRISDDFKAFYNGKTYSA